jgi:LysM repeat protein
MANIQGGALTTRLAIGGAIAVILAVVGYMIWLRPAPEVALSEAALPTATAPEAPAPLAATSQANAPNALPELLVDIFRTDADGATIIAGTSAPGSTIQIDLDGAPLREVQESGGEFVALFEIAPNGLQRLLEIAAIDADGKPITQKRNFIIAPRNVQTAALSTQETPAVSAPETTAEPTTEPAKTAETPAETQVETQAENTPNQATASAQPPAQTPNETAAAPEAPDVLVASSEGIRVVQSGAGPNIEAQVVIDTITYDAEGDVQLAGRAPANGSVRVYIDNAPLKTAKIAPDGQWKTPLPQIDAGVYTLRVDQLGADGSVASRAETPFQREDPAALASLAASQKQTNVTRPAEEQTPATGVQVSRMTVQPGNTLWGIASETYGDGMLFVRLFEANKATIRDPDLIYPGQVFALPER